MPDTIPPSHFLTEMSLGRGCGRVFLKHCLQEPIMTSHCGKRPTIFLNMKSSPATMKRLITCLNTPYKWGAFHYTGPTGQRPLGLTGWNQKFDRIDSQVD